ncbi:MAG TPA: hypothetical protein DEQ17_03560 [Prevotella sp.]|nr:hypothetical protein [Prevotella sp.]
MKHLFFLLSFLLLSSSVILAASPEDSIPREWLEGVSLKPCKKLSRLECDYNIVRPYNFHVLKDGLGCVFICQVGTKFLEDPLLIDYYFGAEVSKMIDYAVKHHYWLEIISSSENDIFSRKRNIVSVSLIPYNLEGTYSYLPPCPEEIDSTWSETGVSIAPAPASGVVTRVLSPFFLGLNNNHAIIINGYHSFMYKWDEYCFHIDNVSRPALALIRLIIKYQTPADVTYDEKTRKIYKIRLNPEWNDTIIVGKAPASRPFISVHGK